MLLFYASKSKLSSHGQSVVRLGPYAQELVSTLNADLWQISFGGGTLQDKHPFAVNLGRRKHGAIIATILASDDRRQ